MAAKKVRHLFWIAAEQLDKMPQRALLDMLRYDSATVLGTDAGNYKLSNANGPTIGRWNSFGITVVATREERI